MRFPFPLQGETGACATVPGGRSKASLTSMETVCGRLPEQGPVNVYER